MNMMGRAANFYGAKETTEENEGMIALKKGSISQV
jgi:hypothetical protein